MNYINEIAAEIRKEIPSTAMPDENSDLLFRLYAVLLRAKGSDVTLSDIHDAWAAWMTSIDPHHEAIVPFERLDEATRREDEPFLAGVLSVARRRAQER